MLKNQLDHQSEVEAVAEILKNSSCNVVTTAVLAMLSQSSDKEDATRLLKDQQAMTSYARLVFKVMASELSRDDLLDMS